MADVVDQETRSRMMSGIQGKNTKPELQIRSALHRRGFRFRVHYEKLPGKPDIALPKYRALILIHGCFWHGHGCHLFKWPKTNSEFWRQKIEGNANRDRRRLTLYRQSGWRTLIIWECALKGSGKLETENLQDHIENWIISETLYSEIPARGISSHTCVAKRNA